MGQEWSIVCWNHHEEDRLGKLRDKMLMVSYFMKHKLKTPQWLPEEDRALIRAIRNFKHRHKRRQVALISDYMDLDDAHFKEVDYDKPLPTKKEIESFLEKARHGESQI